MGYWLFKPEIWLIAGVALVIADMLFGLALFALSVGIAAGLISGMLYLESEFWFANQIILTSWREVFLIFAVLSVLMVFVIRRLFQARNDQGSDINQY